MDKVEKLTDILKRLNRGEEPEKVRAEAKEFLATVEPHELSVAEQKLLEQGLTMDDMQGLCKIHLETLGEELEKMRKKLPKGHVLDTLVAEHEHILAALDELEQVNERIARMDGWRPEAAEFEKLGHIAKHLLEAEYHHQREEEVLFPRLEDAGVYGPPAVMREEHRQLRERKHALKELSEQVGKMDLAEFKRELQELVQGIVMPLREHIFKENNILYPTALQVLKDESVWEELKKECDKIGYCCFTPEE
jgi:DUF438 domain-containing protein